MRTEFDVFAVIYVYHEIASYVCAWGLALSMCVILCMYFSVGNGFVHLISINKVSLLVSFLGMDFVNERCWPNQQMLSRFVKKYP